MDRFSSDLGEAAAQSVNSAAPSSTGPMDLDSLRSRAAALGIAAPHVPELRDRPVPAASARPVRSWGRVGLVFVTVQLAFLLGAGLSLLPLLRGSDAAGPPPGLLGALCLGGLLSGVLSWALSRALRV